MSNIKVAVLGDTGMLGSMVVKVLSEKPFGDDEGFEVHGFNRNHFDAAKISQHDLNILLVDFDYVINCMGLIRPRCTNVEEAIKVNALFPHKLAKVYGIRVIQIATDCADDPDIYGMTKKLGEVEADNVINIRCSIIGLGGNKNNLMEWILEQKGEIKGYIDHHWNGVTTLAFANLCRGIMRWEQFNRAKISFDSIPNFTTADTTKYELLKNIVEVFNLPVKVKGIKAGKNDKRLSPPYPILWDIACYQSLKPHIKDLLVELKEYCDRDRA